MYFQREILRKHQAICQFVKYSVQIIIINITQYL